MPISRIAVGSGAEAGQAHTLKAALAEFISMLVFVFADKLADNGPATPADVIAASLAYAFTLFVAVSVGANIPGGHLNPAVTFGVFAGGHITLTTSAFALSSGMGAWNAVVFEIVMTFGLVYTVYATAVDPEKGITGIIAPIAIGFIVDANILAGGAFDGASMNPAVSFGPAVVSWTWDNHWVYWLGSIAAIVNDA